MSFDAARIGSGRWARRVWLGAVLVAAPSRAQDRLEQVPEHVISPVRVAEALERISSTAPPDFCRRAGYHLAPGEAALCSLAPSARARCPEFAAACERAAGSVTPQPESSAPARSAWLGVLGWLVQLVGLGLLAALGVVCVLALVRLIRARSASRLGERAEDAGTTPSSEATLGAEPRGGPEPHLAKARALAAAGDHARALVELHLGVVSHLDAQGALRARPGRTNGDYARELGQRPELLGAFREITFAVEAVQFGGGRLDAGGFERLLGRAAPLLPALLVGFSLSLGGLGCGEEPAKQTPSAACGTGADGHSLLCELLEATGANVRRRYRSLESLAGPEDDASVLILLWTELGEKGSRALETWVRAGGVLVLTAPLPRIDQQLGVVRSAQPCGAWATVVSSELTLSTIGPGLSAPRLEVDARCASGDAFIARSHLGDGWVAFVPTAAALSNASLAAGDNAPLLVSLLFPAGSVIDLVGSWTRDEPDNPLGQVRAAGLLPWVLQLLALGLCYGLYRGTPFARRRAPPEAGRRRFSEHARALGQRWAEAHAAGAALKAYATWTTEQLRERLPAGTEQSVAGLAHVVSDKTGKPAEAVARTLERARRAQLGAGAQAAGQSAAKPPAREPPADEAEQLSTLKSLGRLLEEIGGPH